MASLKWGWSARETHAQVVRELRRERGRRRRQAQHVAFTEVDGRGLQRMEARHAVRRRLEDLLELQRGREPLADLEQGRQPSRAAVQHLLLHVRFRRLLGTHDGALLAMQRAPGALAHAKPYKRVRADRLLAPVRQEGGSARRPAGACAPAASRSGRAPFSRSGTERLR